jgi:competence protein ComEA
MASRRAWPFLAALLLLLVLGLLMPILNTSGGSVVGSEPEGSWQWLTPTPGIAAESTLAAEPMPVIVVYVTGAVVQAGVFELDAGARLVDAIELAGGALPEADLTVLNLAATLTDGERIYVPLPGETPPAVIGPSTSPSGGQGGSGGSGGQINVNTASAAELTALPGIGPVLADRIVAFRQTNGPFGQLDDLGEVSGIGPKLLANLAELVSF